MKCPTFRKEFKIRVCHVLYMTTFVMTCLFPIPFIYFHFIDENYLIDSRYKECYLMEKYNTAQNNILSNDILDGNTQNCYRFYTFHIKDTDQLISTNYNKNCVFESEYEFNITYWCKFNINEKIATNQQKNNKTKYNKLQRIGMGLAYGLFLISHILIGLSIYICDYCIIVKKRFISCMNTGSDYV